MFEIYVLKYMLNYQHDVNKKDMTDYILSFIYTVHTFVITSPFIY